MVYKVLGDTFEIDENLLAGYLTNLNLTKYMDEIEEICDQACQEAKMEKTLRNIEEFWDTIEFEF